MRILLFAGLCAICSFTTVAAEFPTSSPEDQLIHRASSYDFDEELTREESLALGARALSSLEAVDIRQDIWTAHQLVRALGNLEYAPAEPFLLKTLNNPSLFQRDEIELRVAAASALVRLGSKDAREQAIHYLCVVEEWHRLHGPTSPTMRMSEAAARASWDNRMLPVAIRAMCRGTGHDVITTSVIYKQMQQGLYTEQQTAIIMDGVWEALTRCLLPDSLDYGARNAMRILMLHWDTLNETQKTTIRDSLSRMLSDAVSNVEYFQQRELTSSRDQHAALRDEILEMLSEID